MHAREIAKLAHVHLKNLGARAAEQERTFSERLGESIHHKLGATAAVVTTEKFISFSRCCMESKRDK
jgi:hypothetical protein